MDGYAEKMLYDDVSTDKTMNIECPKCHLQVSAKITDEFIKCKKCGEIFYIEEMDEEPLSYS